MSFTELNLNIDAIVPAIESFREGVTFSKTPHNGFDKFNITLGDRCAVLNVFYKQDGKISIGLNEGKHKEFNEEVARHIVERTSFDKKINAPIYIKKLEQNFFDSLVEYLTGYCEATQLPFVNIQYGKKYTFQSKYGDKIFLNYYNTKSFNVQGKNGLLKSQVIEGLCNYLHFSDIVEATLESYDIDDLDKSKVEQLYESRLPNANKVLGETVKSIILPSFVTERLNIDTTDYTFMVFPVFRGIEGYMKQLLESKGIIVAKTFGEVFTKDTSTDKFVIKPDKLPLISCIFIEACLLKLYNFHNDNRHKLFHVDGTVDTTAIIDNINDAKALINESLDLIEKCATSISTGSLKPLE